MKTSIIRATASTAKIVGHIWATWKAAAVTDDEVRAAAEARLGPHTQALTETEAELKDARDAEGSAKAAMLRVDQKACHELRVVRDGMWNAIGRPRFSVFMDQVFPGGSEVYTRGSAHGRPALIELAKQRIGRAQVQPKWKDSLATWVAQVSEHQPELAAAVDVHRTALLRLEVAEKCHQTAARTALIALEMLGRDLQNLGLSTSQIHSIIPDARLLAKPAAKPPEAPPASDTDGPSPPAPRRTAG